MKTLTAPRRLSFFAVLRTVVESMYVQFVFDLLYFVVSFLLSRRVLTPARHYTLIRSFLVLVFFCNA